MYCPFHMHMIVFLYVIKLDAPTPNQRRRYCVKLITPRVRCEGSERFTCVLKLAPGVFRRQYDVTIPV